MAPVSPATVFASQSIRVRRSTAWLLFSRKCDERLEEMRSEPWLYGCFSIELAQAPLIKDGLAVLIHSRRVNINGAAFKPQLHISSSRLTAIIKFPLLPVAAREWGHAGVELGRTCYTGGQSYLSLLPLCFCWGGTHGYEEHSFEMATETIFIVTGVLVCLLPLHFDICKRRLQCHREPTCTRQPQHAKWMYAPLL